MGLRPRCNDKTYAERIREPPICQFFCQTLTEPEAGSGFDGWLQNRNIMQGNFNSIIQSATPVLVDFYADWCQPCKIQSPILHELAHELQGQLRIVQINVDKNPEISNRYRVQSIPTLMLFKQGNMVWKHSGVLPKQQLIDVVKSVHVR